MIRGVIFDVDGVLLNSMPVWENLGELYLKGRGIAAEKGLGEKLFTMSLEEGAQYAALDCEMTCEQVVKGLAREVREFYAERVPLKEGARQFIEEFRERKIPMAIATSGDRENTEAALKRLKIYSYFQGIFTCSGIGSGKNQPDIYYAAALQLDTDAKETLVFEDAYHALRTAKKAGFKTVAVYDRSNDKIWHISGIWRIFICRNLQTLICSGKG